MPDRDPPAVLTTLEACALLGVARHTLREWECRGLLARLGKVNIGAAVTVTYDRAALFSAQALAVKPPKPLRIKPEPPPPLTIPEGMLTAAEVAATLGVKPYTVNQMQREGRLMPAEWVTPPQGGSPVRLYREDEVVALAEVRDYRAPVQRIAAVADAMRGGLPMGEALVACGVPLTTWYYWTRHRRDAALANEIVVPSTRRPTPESRTRGASVIGRVYFATSAGPRDAVKIGWTACDPDQRLASLQTGSPTELRFLAVVVAHSPFEAWCHRQFEDDRKYGEWFARTPRLTRFVSRLAEIGDVTTFTPGELLALLNVEPLSLFGGTHGPTP